MGRWVVALASAAALPLVVGCGSPKTDPSRAGTSAKADDSGASLAASASAQAAPSSGTVASSGKVALGDPSSAPSASNAVDATSGASTSYPASGGASPGGVAPSGQIDVSALRKAHRERIAKDDSPVTVLQKGTALELGQRLCEAVVPKKPADTPILLKPNICGFDAMRDPASHGGDDGVKGRTTDPEFVRGVVRCLKARGHDHITIAEGCSLPHDGFEKLVTITGYAAMAKAEGVPLVAMDDDGTYDVQGMQPGKPMKVTGIDDTPVPTLLLPKILAEHLEHGLFISLPKVKTHRFSVFSLAIKGMQGTVMTSDKSPAHQQKWRMHRELNDYLKTGKSQTPDDRAGYVKSLEAFADRMAAVLEISAPDVVLAEGAPAMGGDGFGSLVPYPESFAIGGTNPISVDQVGARLLGLYESDKLALGLRGHKTSPLLEAAQKRFGVDVAHARVTGDGASLLDAPRAVHFKAIAPFQIDFDPPKK